MPIAFLPASELKPKFQVVGHFYTLMLPGTDGVPCRSVLEITARGAPAEVEADAVVVMMNPGSSRPLEACEHEVGVDAISTMTPHRVPTMPDTTQYQVMRLMHHRGWQHVRVLNLSDLREPKSAVFVQRFSELEQLPGGEAHSMFSSLRTAELQRHLRRKPEAPIVCAWGVSERLDPLIARALPLLETENPLMGLAKSDQPGKYFHPLPTLQRQKEQWVLRMLALFSEPQPAAALAASS